MIASRCSSTIRNDLHGELISIVDRRGNRNRVTVRVFKITDEVRVTNQVVDTLIRIPRRIESQQARVVAGLNH